VDRVSAEEAAGEPTSYLTLEEGTKVLSSDGEEIGRVAHVLADEADDIFDGIVIEADGRHVFADAPLIEELRTDAVTLKLDAAACGSLPEPSENPAALKAGPDDTVPDGMSDKLHRAWDRISGNY
jgi:hypothetical protein